MSSFSKELDKLCQTLLESEHSFSISDNNSEILNEREAIRVLNSGVLFTPQDINILDGIYHISNSILANFPWSSEFLYKAYGEYLKEIYSLYQEKLIEEDSVIDLAPAIAEWLLEEVYKDKEDGPSDLIQELQNIAESDGATDSVDARDLVSVSVEELKEVAPKGWEKTIKAMKKHKDITNPWALAWYMKNKGYKPKVKESKDLDNNLKNPNEAWSKDNPKIIDVYLSDDGRRYIGYTEEDKNMLKKLINASWFDSRLINIEQFNAKKKGYEYNIVSPKLTQQYQNNDQSTSINGEMDGVIKEMKRLAGLL